MFILLAMLTLSQTSPPAPAVQPGALMGYDEVIRCAGLTQAASELEGGESDDGQSLYDAALYWSLTAGQAAAASNRSPDAAEADQRRARLDAVRRLSAGEAETRAALQRCRRRTPDLG